MKHLILVVLGMILLACSTPESVETLYSNGLTHFKNKEFLSARQYLDKAIEVDENYYPAYLLRAKVFRNRSEYAKALNDVNTYLKSGQNQYEGYAEKALIKYKMADYYGAVSDCNKALKSDPDAGSAIYMIRGKAKLKIEDTQGAIDDFNRVINENENFAEAYVKRGDAFNVEGKTEHACADYDRAANLGDLLAYKRLRKVCPQTKTIVVEKQVENKEKEIKVVKVEPATKAKEANIEPPVTVESGKSDNELVKYSHLEGHLYSIRDLIKTTGVVKGQTVDYGELGSVISGFMSVKAIDENNYFIQFFLEGELAYFGAYQYIGKEENHIVYRRTNVDFDEEIRFYLPVRLNRLVESHRYDGPGIFEIRNYSRAIGVQVRI